MKHSNNYSTVTSKGQITIPASIRNKLELVSGSKIEFILQDGCMIIMPITNTLSKLRGVLPKPQKALTCEELNNIIRNPHDRN